MIADSLLYIASSPAGALPIRKRMGPFLWQCLAASSSLKMTSAMLGCVSVSYFKFLKYSISPNPDSRRRISRDSPRFDGRGVMRRCSARFAVDLANDVAIVAVNVVDEQRDFSTFESFKVQEVLLDYEWLDCAIR